MSTKPTTGRLFDTMVDDAAMFPPANASARTAVGDHIRHRDSWYARMVGPLLVHRRRWEDLREAHEAAGSPPMRVVVLGSTRRPDRLCRGVSVVGYEAAGADPLNLSTDGSRTAVELEPTRADATLDAVSAARSAGLDVIAKYRTGGTSAEAFPSEAEVAGVIVSAVTRGVPMKFTAGLHAPIRHTGVGTMFEHHGFLNLLVAVRQAQTGADEPTVVAWLATRDTATVVAHVRGWSTDDVTSVRQGFVSFGCCGVEDPITAGVALGVISRGTT